MDTTQDFWSRRAPRYDDQLRDDEAAYDNRIEATLSLLSKNDRVLDIGCATGEIGLDIAPHVARYDGCDPAAGMIAIAEKKSRDRHVTNARFVVTTAFDRSFEEQPYDAVLLFSVLHLVPDPVALLLRTQELLRPGGTLIVETPSLGEQSVFKKCLIRLLTAPVKGLKIRPLRYPEIKDLVREAGFEITHAEETHVGDRLLWISAQSRKVGILH